MDDHGGVENRRAILPGRRLVIIIIIIIIINEMYIALNMVL